MNQLVNIVNLLEVQSFVKEPIAPSVVFNLYNEITSSFTKQWSVLNRKEKLKISSNLNHPIEYIGRLLSDPKKALSLKQLFKLCYFFNQDLILVKGGEKIVFSINDLSIVNSEMIRFNKIIFEIIKPFSANYVYSLTKIEAVSLYTFKDIYVTRRNFVRYMRILLNFGIQVYFVPNKKVKFKEIKNVA